MLAAVALACLAPASCQRGGPKRAAPPTKAEHIAAVQEQLKVRVQAVRARPESAAAEIGLLAESVESLARTVGPPFDALLTEIRDVKTSLDGKPSPKAVKEGIDRLEQKASALQP